MGYVSYLEDIEDRIGTQLNAIEAAAANPTVSLRDLKKEVDGHISICRDLLAELRERTEDPGFRAELQEIDRLDKYHAAKNDVAKLKRQASSLGRLVNHNTAAIRKRDSIITATSKEGVGMRESLREREAEIRILKSNLVNAQESLKRAHSEVARIRKLADRLQKEIDDGEWQKYTRTARKR